MVKTKTALFAAGIVLAMVFTHSCSSDGGGGDGGSVTYEGQTYKTVKIGAQTWMAENLNYNVSGSKCFGEGGTAYIYDEETDDDIEKTLSGAEVQANCLKYGRLYDWSTAMGLPSSCNWSGCSSQIQSNHRGICPIGWHIPSNADWDELFIYVDAENDGDGSYTAGMYLKATTGWSNNGNGTDKYGFSALPGGYGDSDGSFGDVGYRGFWWSASEDHSSSAFYWIMHNYDSYVDRSYGSKSVLFSVRCLQD